MATIVTPISVDPEDLFQQFVDFMQANIPGWQPSDGSLDVWMAEGFAQIAEQATDVTTSIFRWYGANVANVPPIDAVAASSTITITGTSGFTVAAGYNLALADANGTLIGFVTTTDAVLTGGTAAGVPIIASAQDGQAGAGASGNGLSGTVTQVDSVADVSTVTLDASTAGGSDAESDDDYLPRLIAEEQLRTVAPILPRDFAQLSKRVLEVDRCAYLDGYNTADGTSNNALMVTLTPLQADGSNVSSPGKTAIIDQFGEDGATPALVGFVVNVADPNRTAVGVAFTAVAEDGWDPVDAKASGEQAVQDYLDPANWGQPTTGEQRKFSVTPKVKLGALYRVLYDADGIHDVTALTVGLSGGSLSAADYTLPVTTSNPVPISAGTGTVTGTVT
jgi:uncharacterized phage protein gp47/JayE